MPDQIPTNPKSETSEAKRVLIVEDDPDMRSFYADYLSRVYNVETASDGEEGLKKLAERPFDLLLLDIMLPKLDGIEFLKKKNTQPSIAPIPTVMLTNLSNEDIIKQCFKLGAKQYIFKSETSPDKILLTLSQALSA